MNLPKLKIRHIETDIPIIQGGMGVGISWENLAGSVAACGAIGVVSAVGTGYRHPDLVKRDKYGRPIGTVNAHSAEALKRIIQDAKEIAGGKGAIGVNILSAITDYGRVARDAAEAGADLIISGAGLPLSLPQYVEGYDVALVPIVSSARALNLICKTWKRRYDRLPDAVVLEGPKSGGHQGFKYEDCFKPEYQLENLLPSVLEEAKRWGDIPVIVAGGVWSYKDIVWYIERGAAGVQMATRFVATHECDAPLIYKEVVLNSEEEDIVLLKSPVGYPLRVIKTPFIERLLAGVNGWNGCVSNCVTPCNRGEEAKKVGFCIADRLGAAWLGNYEEGIFIIGANGHLLKKQGIISVKELLDILTGKKPDPTLEEDPIVLTQK
ncbi:nitronate monooxygenase [Hydrogenivirga caldilitoris]|uniref:Nitronate monooxygenase n=1 Tax=Hydrogenivirga caldilitoris TaxID=246264 RepID=A0A497XLZ3_9AQUI|nr:nitronate monooxygenase family protein [Hydrogenivirga caldilitoris]RLJ69906.1 nitronate monooxygenase [Hydrogenivirga caldilitoris]